jgi:hypothetical protein
VGLVAGALDISHRTVMKIRQNLFWAFAYNVAGIPLAALGYLSPVVAGAAMAPGEAPTFLALGLGYIAVESVFVPKFTLFLGNPVHALSVVLFALLASSGLGSALSARLVGGDRRRLGAVAAAVAALLVLEGVGLHRVFEAALAWPFAARCALAVALIALPGALMGVPFPTSLALGSAARDEDARGPWAAQAWVLNGYASVVGSVGAMIVAIAWGFTAVLAAAALCYALVAALAWRGAGVSLRR